MKTVELTNQDNTEKSLVISCPGCGEYHPLRISGEGRPVWTWNGDREKPTFTPSLMVRIGPTVCHSFITDGRIQFLNDCTHDKRGQTLDLPECDW